MAKLFAYQQSINGPVSFIQTDDATVDAQWGSALTNWTLEDGTPIVAAWRYANATLNNGSNGVATFSGLVEYKTNPAYTQLTQSSISPLGGGCAFTAGTDRFANIGGTNAVDTTNNTSTRLVFTKPWTITGFYAKIDAAAGSGKTVTITIMKNGTDSAVAIPITGTSATAGHNLTDSIGGNAGDDVNIHITSTSGGSATKAAWGFTVQQ